MKKLHILANLEITRDKDMEKWYGLWEERLLKVIGIAIKE